GTGGGGAGAGGGWGGAGPAGRETPTRHYKDPALHGCSSWNQSPRSPRGWGLGRRPTVTLASRSLPARLSFIRAVSPGASAATRFSIEVGSATARPSTSTSTSPAFMPA